MHWLFEPGFFSSQPVRTAFVIGGVVAVVSAVVGVFKFCAANLSPGTR